MSVNNAISFDDLEREHQEQLLDYICDNFVRTTSFNHKATAYGLKQEFTRLYPNKKNHVTSQCFMEAMVKSGYRAKLINTTEPLNWCFDAKTFKI